jgi:hypothetical protein
MNNEPGHCTRCGYELVGTRDAVCLTCRECGEAVERGPLGCLYNADGSFHEHDDADPNEVFRVMWR